MSGLAINFAPLMTRHLVDELRVFEGDPIVIFDVGGRGGINKEWLAFGDQLQVYCFEPDAEECNRLASQAPPQVRYIARALGKSSGAAVLYEARLPASTSLYKTRMGYFGRFLNRDNGATVGERKIEVATLDEVIAEYGIRNLDFIKLDVEGAELDVLQGGIKALETPRVLGVLSEIRLHREINGSPPFAELDNFLRVQGFSLYDIEINRHSRVALPYPGLANYVTTTGERFFGYTLRGQVQDGDALYFRDLFASAAVSPVSMLKVCALMEIYSLNDCAAELILENKKILQPISDPDRLLDLLSAGIDRRYACYQEYLAAYFNSPAPPSGEPSEQTSSPSITDKSSKVEASDWGIDAPSHDNAAKRLIRWLRRR